MIKPQITDQEELATRGSLEWWRNEHDHDYFPRQPGHAGWRIYDEIAPYFAEHLPPRQDDDALEIGCGYGEWMIPLTRRVRSVVGIDIHPTVIAKAREFIAQRGIANASVYLTNGQAIPFLDGVFSLVYCISVFQHIPRVMVRQYMMETGRVLAPGGRVLYQFRFAGGGGTWSDDIGTDQRVEHSVGWTEQQVMEDTAAAGLKGRTIIVGPAVVFVGSRRGDLEQC